MNSLCLMLTFYLLNLVNSTHRICLKTNHTCTGEFKYNCDKFICSNKQEYCRDYNSLAYLIACPICKILKSAYYDLRMFNEMKHIKPCSSRLDLFENEICLNKQNCYQIIQSDNRTFRPSIKLKTIRKVSCKCNGQYKFSCNEYYCARSQLTCNKLNINEIDLKMKKTKFEIKNCEFK